MRKRERTILSCLFACAVLAGGNRMEAQAAVNLETDASVAGVSVAINNYYAGSLNPEEELAAAFSSEEILSGGAQTSAREETPHVKAAAGSDYDNVAISRVSNYVNVRAEANTSSAVVGKIYNNCAATILATVDGEGGDWYQIQSGNVKGYIKAQYFITGAEAEAVARQVGTSYARVANTSTLRLRESPSLESRTLDLLSPEAEYEVIGEEGDFAKISVDNDLVGYVFKDYIDIRVEFDQAVTAEEEKKQQADEAKRKEEAKEAIERLEEVKKEAAKAETKAPETTKAPTKAETKAPETEFSGTVEANPAGGQTKAPTKAETKAPETTKAPTKAETKAPETTKAPAGPGSGPGSSSSGGGAVESATRSAIVAYAKQFLGNPYVYGGTSLTNGADCSGFTQAIYAHFGITTGRSSRDQAARGTEIAVGEVQPGDLLFYASGNYINHVAMYIGGGQVIHASTERTGITISPSNYRTPCKAVTFLD